MKLFLATVWLLLVLIALVTAAFYFADPAIIVAIIILCLTVWSVETVCGI